MVDAGDNSPKIMVIGYGNMQRRDDGIGPYMITKLKQRFRGDPEAEFLAVSQLTLELVEDLCLAGAIIFIDATVHQLENGWRCGQLLPESGPSDFQTHHLSPEFIMCLLEALYDRSPPAWLIAVQGDDFGFGHGVTPAARRRAAHAIEKVFEFIENIIKRE